MSSRLLFVTIGVLSGLAACATPPAPTPSPGRLPVSSESPAPSASGSATTASGPGSSPADPSAGLVVLSEGGALEMPGTGWTSLADLSDARWLAGTPTGLAVTLPEAVLLGESQVGGGIGWRRVVPRWEAAAPDQPLASAVPSPDGAAIALTAIDPDTTAATVSVLALDGSARVLLAVEAALWPAASWIDKQTIAMAVFHERSPGSLCVSLVDIRSGAISPGPCGDNLILAGSELALVASHTRDAASLFELRGWLSRTPGQGWLLAHAASPDATLEAAGLDQAGQRLAVAWWDGGAGKGTLEVYGDGRGFWLGRASFSLTKRTLGLAWLP